MFTFSPELNTIQTHVLDKTLSPGCITSRVLDENHFRSTFRTEMFSMLKVANTYVHYHHCSSNMPSNPVSSPSSSNNRPPSLSSFDKLFSSVFWSGRFLHSQQEQRPVHFNSVFDRHNVLLNIQPRTRASTKRTLGTRLLNIQTHNHS